MPDRVTALSGDRLSSAMHMHMHRPSVRDGARRYRDTAQPPPCFRPWTHSRAYVAASSSLRRHQHQPRTARRSIISSISVRHRRAARSRQAASSSPTADGGGGAISVSDHVAGRDGAAFPPASGRASSFRARHSAQLRETPTRNSNSRRIAVQHQRLQVFISVKCMSAGALHGTPRHIYHFRQFAASL